MPPIPLDHEVVPEEQVPLTDRDVEILHEIITRAEKHADVDRLPFRAIFAAYDVVLSENGIKPDQDQTYLRFLFQLGDKRQSGEALYERFEELLEQMGIHLEYSNTVSENSGQARGIAEEYVNGNLVQDARRARVDGDALQRRYRRRASFNSLYDAANDATQRSAYRPSSRSSVSRLEIGQYALGPRTPFEETSQEKIRASFNRSDPLVSFREAGKWIATNDTPDINRHKENTESLNENVQSRHWFAVPDHVLNREPSQINAERNPGSYAWREPVESFSADTKPVVEAELPPGLLPRQRKVLRGLLVRWLESAMCMRQTHRDMQNVAISKDTVTLLRQAFDIWRGALQQKLQEAHTERFFRHLEKRAARARDLYLLTKAFTHWAQVTSDEVERTSAAKQHILRVKYFNAWREITAVNELKTQRLALRNPFYAWKAKFRRLQQSEVDAIAVYGEKLTKGAYWCWFWTFCDRRVPQWRDYRLKQRSLISWLRALRTQRERDHDIDTDKRRNLLQLTFQKLSQRSAVLCLALRQADSKWKAKLIKENVMEWHVHGRLGPMARQVSNMVDLRVVRSATNIWILRTRMAAYAQNIDRLRILRNTWTAWKGRLRWEALAARIDERVTMQTLYKWVLMARFRLMTRIHEHRLKGKMLVKLVTNPRVIYSWLLENETHFRYNRTRQLLGSKFSCWQNGLASQRQRDRVALEFYAPRREQAFFDVWKNREKHVARMETWAKKARFYFLTTKSIKQWHATTLKSSKKRRQGAYTTIRRKIKMNMALKPLSSWRSRASIINGLDNQATHMHQNKLFKKGTEFFDRWNYQAACRKESLRDSVIYHNRQLVHNHLTHWVRSFSSLHIQASKASQFLEIHVSGLATSQFRKLSLRIFQIRTSLETADALSERNLRKHFMSMFRHWLDTARVQRNSRPPTRSAAAGADGNVPQPEENITEWPHFDPALRLSELAPADLFTQTPLPTPGYLSTPSKRATRTRALAQISTTPTTPLRTPFASRLVAQTFAEPLPSRDNTNTKNTPGSNVQFVGHLEPESPTEARSTNRMI